MEILIVLIFCAALASCIVTGLSVLYALLFGLVIFLIYGKIKGFTVKALAGMCLDGIKKSKKILFTFVLIGMMTGIWRASGCIPSIVCYACELISPKIMIIMTFLLCTGISFITGTSFGTATTIGVICASIARSMNIPMFWIGGAVLSGSYFGDRCSPASTSAMLVSTLTETEFYTNIKNMLKSAAVPFIAACAVYTSVSITMKPSTEMVDVFQLFGTEFHIEWTCLIPAVTIIILALFKVKVAIMMSVSIVLAFGIALFTQETPLFSLLKCMVIGYAASSEELGNLINGGGIISMLKVTGIVCIASCYSGIFKETGLLDFLEKPISMAEKTLGKFAVFFVVSAFIAVISCNQTLPIILTAQLLSHIEPDKYKRANYIEDSAVIVAPLVPWAIASSVPLTAIGAPESSVLAACYLYFLPLWGMLKYHRETKTVEKNQR